MAKRTKSSRRWLQEHESDVFVQRARATGLRSRAAFKLEDIQRSDRILKPGMTVVDLGAAPGGWSQYAARVLHGRGRVVALDILPMDAIVGVEFLQGRRPPPACNVRSGPQHVRHVGCRPRPIDASG